MSTYQLFKYPPDSFWEGTDKGHAYSRHFAEQEKVTFRFISLVYKEGETLYHFYDYEQVE